MLRIESLAHEVSVTGLEARTTEDMFVGRPHWMTTGRIFGGQVVAQALVAAQHTVDASRPVHSLHGYFLRPGDTSQPVTYSVDRLHDGRSFSTRRTQAYQDGVPILSLISSFQLPDEAPSFANEMPTGIPPADSLPSVEELLAHVPQSNETAWIKQRPIDIRYVNAPIYLDVSEASTHQAVWMRSTRPLPDDPAVHRAALAYASDISILEPILRGFGVAWMTPGLKIASLDHAIWFHRDARADDWLLYVQDANAAQSGRGLVLGRFFTQAGELVATVAQEGMVRLPR